MDLGAFWGPSGQFFVFESHCSSFLEFRWSIFSEFWWWSDDDMVMVWWWASDDLVMIWWWSGADLMMIWWWRWWWSDDDLVMIWWSDDLLMICRAFWRDFALNMPPAVDSTAGRGSAACGGALLKTNNLVSVSSRLSRLVSSWRLIVLALRVWWPLGR